MADNSLTHFDIMTTQLLRKDIHFAFFCRADATRIALSIWNGVPISSLLIRQLTPDIDTSGTITSGGIEIDRGFHLFAWDGLSDRDASNSSANNFQVIAGQAPIASGIQFHAVWSSPLTSYLSADAQAHDSSVITIT